MVTLKKILEGVVVLQRAVTQWENDGSAPVVNWRGSPRRAVSEDIQQAAVALFDLVDRLDVEPDAHALVLAIDAFDDAFTRWAEDCQRRPDQTDPSGGTTVWTAYAAVLSATKPPVYRKPEPIQALVAQHVPYAQIAKIYGWRDAAGAPDLHKVQEEITAPGTHYKPAEWVHPAQRRHEAEIAERWSVRTERLGAGRRDNSAARPERREAPESVEQLIRQGVSSRQIAKMKRISEEDVRAMAAEMGVPLDGNIIADAFYRQSQRQQEEADISRQAEDLRLANKKDYAELGDDLEARVLFMASDGLKAREIVKILGPAFPGLQYQKVTKIIKDGEPAGKSE